MDLFSGTSGLQHNGWPPMGPPTVARYKQKTLLDQIRELMISEGIGIYIVEMQDEHDSEYVAGADKRIEFISGFAGSAGVCIIGMDFAELATDSRYWIRASKELHSGWTIRKMGKSGEQSWQTSVVEIALKNKLKVGADPLLVPYSLAESLSHQGVSLQKVTKNLVDVLWKDRPKLPDTPVFQLPDNVAGESFESKLEAVRKRIVDKGAKVLVVYQLGEIAWLFNLRAGDVPYDPVFKSFAIITEDSVSLYCDLNKCKDILHLYPSVRFGEYGEFLQGLSDSLVSPKQSMYSSLKSLVWSEKPQEAPKQTVWIPGGASWAIIDTVASEPGVEILSEISPVNLLRAIKNPVEIAWARECHRKCSLSIVKYFAWLKHQVANGTAPNEYDGGLKLLEIRESLPGFLGLSFETISAVGPNASSPHYSPSKENSAPITDKDVYLLDSGSHFTGASTDITRTVHFGTPKPEEISAYTNVFRGHIGVSRAVFPQGTSGYTLDILARQHLWKQGWNYLHGSGHGVGAYLSIHELPMGIGMSSGIESILVPGHLTSIEPGYYEDNVFGVRIESEILVRQAETKHHFGTSPYLTFDTLTLVPYDRKLLDLSQLNADEIAWLDDFNKNARKILGPDLDKDELEWLEYHTAPTSEW